MVDHTIEANIVVTSDETARQRKAEERIVELLAEAIAGEHPTFRERIDAKMLARAIYRGVIALPAIIERVKNELHL